MYKGIGIEFCWILSHCGLYWNEISDKLAEQGAVKNMSEISSNNLLLSSHEINSLLKKTVYKQTEKLLHKIYPLSFYSSSFSIHGELILSQHRSQNDILLTEYCICSLMPLILHITRT